MESKRLGRGGARSGSGPKIKDPSGAKRKSRTIAVTDAELRSVRAFLVTLRYQGSQSEWTE